MRRIATSIFAFSLFGLFQPVELLAQDRGSRAINSGGASRIVGGQEVRRGDAPWAVVLLKDGSFHCGGSLVAPQTIGEGKVRWKDGVENPSWVITAAHCLYDNVPPYSRLTSDRLSVLSGTLNRTETNSADSDSAEVEKVRFIMEHEDYNRSTLENDIALLYLKDNSGGSAKDIDKTIRASIALPDDFERDWVTTPYLQVRAQGWGATSESGDTSTKLLEVRLPLMDYQTCNEKYAGAGSPLAPGMICAGYARGEFDSCQGDSGGPLIYRSRSSDLSDARLVGAVSWGIGCARPNFPGIYSSTVYFQQWLNKVYLKCDEHKVGKNCNRQAKTGTTLVGAKARGNMITGSINLVPEGCETSAAGLCKLDGILRYEQTPDLVWETDSWPGSGKQSGTTDGASIPKWAQPIIGKPFDRSYLKAAILHDHYCYEENHVRPWQQVHRMFYDALLASGVSNLKARTMYYAVYLGGPRWKKIVPGENCGVGCIKNLVQSGEAKTDDGGAPAWTDDKYEANGFRESLRQFHEELVQLEKDGQTLPEFGAIEQRAEKARLTLK